MTSPSPMFTPSSFGGIALTGWIGQSPQDGGDFPFLLLYTTRGGDLGPDAAPPAMSSALGLHGLRVGQMLRGPEQLAGTTARITLTDEAVELRMGPDAEVVASAAITDEWESIARARGEVMLTACTRPYRKPAMTLERLEVFMSEPETQRASAFAFLPFPSPLYRGGVGAGRPSARANASDIIAVRRSPIWN